MCFIYLQNKAKTNREQSELRASGQSETIKDRTYKAKQLPYLQYEWKLEQEFNRSMRFGRGSGSAYRVLASAVFMKHAREEPK